MTDETSDDDLFDDMLLNDSLDQFSDGDMNDDLAETIEEAQLAMAEARARLADVPAEVVITNHVMGLYELGAIHLSAVAAGSRPGGAGDRRRRLSRRRARRPAR